jgi:7-cyano-7-deazaguanine synthase
MMKNLVLFSGGIDSTTALYWALKRADQVCALTFDYSQRHVVEIQVAQRLLKKLKVPHKIFRIDMSQIGGSALTEKRILLPEFERIEEISEDVPATYVPFRNGIFLSVAAAWAEVKNIRQIVCGFNVVDSPRYPDTQASFVRAMEKAINSGTAAFSSGKSFKILAPFVDMKKAEIIDLGLALKADYSYSISCYAGSEIPCQKCSACLIRRKAWEDVGQEDHLLMRLEKEGKI